MPARFTVDDVRGIASLASLELEEAELELFARQLGQILEYAEQVQQVDTSGVPPTASTVTRHVADREDVPRPSLYHDEALANAPDRSGGGDFFRVPRVLG